MTADTIIVVLLIAFGAKLIGEHVPEYFGEPYGWYAMTIAAVLWVALVLQGWKQWQRRR